MSDNKSKSQTSANANAERLKAEGNTLYTQRKYRAAYKKYTEAIKEDRKNPILWSNRAACSLAIKEYLDAAADANKAVRLDPNYAKAWSRLATAFQGLCNWEKSVNAWKKALSSLPSEALSEQEQKLKTQFEAGLKEAQTALAKGESFQDSQVRRIPTGVAPWDRALAMEGRIIGKMSSAWVIMNAFRDFEHGLDVLRNQTQRTIGTQKFGQGSLGALADSSNAILRDTRVFHVSDKDFFERYNDQVEGESQATGGMENCRAKANYGGSPSKAQEIWVGRPSEGSFYYNQGVDYGRFLKNTIMGTPSPAFYRNAIEVLEWGRRTWKDVPRDDRGVIFDLTFIRGVKRLYMKAIMEQFSREGPNSGLSLDEIADLAQSIIDEVQANPHDMHTSPTPEIDTGFWASFWPYPEGDAHAILGWYHMQLAVRGADPTTRRAEYIQAAYLYNQAANCFPGDDGYRPYFLKISLEGLWWAGLPLKATLQQCAKIRECMPGVKKIWEHSPFSSQLNRLVEQALTFETDYRDHIEQGEVSEDDVTCPEGIIPVSTEPIDVEDD